MEESTWQSEPLAALQHEFAEALRRDAFFGDNRVTVVEQDSPDLATLIQTELGALDGPVAVVGVDSVSAHAGDWLDFELSVNITENVVSNRVSGAFATALAVAFAVRNRFDGRGNCHFVNLSHRVADGGALVATVNFSLRRKLVEG